MALTHNKTVEKVNKHEKQDRKLFYSIFSDK